MSEKSGPEKVEILWDQEHTRFKTSDGKAYLTYTMRPSQGLLPGVLNLQHTFVPTSFRGRGVAACLCVAAFKHAKKMGLLVEPTCSYVSDTFLPRNSEWNYLVVKDGMKAGL